MIRYFLGLKILKYLLVGVLTVGIDYLTIYITYSIFSLHYIIAVCFGFLMSNIFQFYMNFFYTFSLKKDSFMSLQIIVFCIAVGIGNAIALAIIMFLQIFIESLFLIKTLSLPFSFIYGYTISKTVIFNKSFYSFLLDNLKK